MKQDDTSRIPRIPGQKGHLSIRKPIWMSQQEQQTALSASYESISTELAVADDPGIGLPIETAAEVTINSSEGPQQE